MAGIHHKVAISNERIIQLEDGKVTFRYRDYRDSNKNKPMTLDIFEFIRRFLLHVLPNRYMKIRYYGLFSNRNRKKKQRICKEILGVIDRDKKDSPKAESWQELLLRITGEDPRICPCCGKGQMVTKDKLSPTSNAPPLKIKAVS